MKQKTEEKLLFTFYPHLKSHLCGHLLLLHNSSCAKYVQPSTEARVDMDIQTVHEVTVNNGVHYTASYCFVLLVCFNSWLFSVLLEKEDL